MPGGDFYVGQSFKPPGAGKRKTWNGAFFATFTPDVSISSGTGCTASDSKTLRLNLISSRETVTFTDYVVLPLPSLAGGTLHEFTPMFGSSVLQIDGMTAGRCTPPKVPIP